MGNKIKVPKTSVTIQGEANVAPWFPKPFVSSEVLVGSGDNAAGQLNQGNTVTPKVDLLIVDSTKNWAELSSSFDISYFIDELGGLYGVGSNLNSQLGPLPHPQSNIVQIGAATNWVKVAAGKNHGYAINDLGELWGIGDNSNGQLGQGDLVTPHSALVQIGAATNWVSLASGTRAGWFLNDLGELWACGANSSGQLGQGDQVTPVDTLVQMGAATNWVSIGSQNRGTLYAINSLGELWVTGKNENGQGGQGNTDLILSLTQIGTATNWVYASAAGSSGYAINDLGELWGTGRNSEGQLGQGSFSADVLNLVQIGSATNWEKVIGGSLFVVALNSLGEIWTCGQNNKGQLGDGTIGADSHTLNKVGSDKDWEDISCGQEHTCHLKATPP